MPLLQPSAKGRRRRRGARWTRNHRRGSRRRGRRSQASQWGCFSVPVGEGAEGGTGAETAEVGIAWVYDHGTLGSLAGREGGF